MLGKVAIIKMASWWTEGLILLAFTLALPSLALSQEWTTNGSDIHNANIGSVGIGTIHPLAILHARTTVPGSWSGIFTNDNATRGSGILIESITGGADPHNEYMIATRVGGIQHFTVNAFGNVGIGTMEPATKLHVVGDVTVTGNIAAKYQDVAEWVPTSRALEPGTVVVLDTEHTNQVLASALAYDTRVAGVVSDRPGLLLGEAAAEKVKVATTGRLKVKVDANRSPIRVGDLLVTSDKPGMAMRSDPLDLGGIPIHRPGTLLGKALEPLSTGEGEILVLLSLQ